MTESEALRVLHLDAHCTASEIRQAYTDLVKVWHPDRFQADPKLRERAERTLQQINDAYAVLEARQQPAASRAVAAEPEAASPAAGTGAPAQDTVGSPVSQASGMRLRSAVLAGAGIGVVIGALVALALAFPPTPADPAAGLPTEPTEAAPDSAAIRPAQPQRGDNGQRPESGSELVQPAQTGGCTLVVSNDTNVDGVVVLAQADADVRALYVRSGERLTVTNIAPGLYEVRLMLGRGWRDDTFTRDVAYRELDAPVEFVQRDEADGVQFTRFSLSLQSALTRGAGARDAAAFHVRTYR